MEPDLVMLVSGVALASVGGTVAVLRIVVPALAQRKSNPPPPTHTLETTGATIAHVEIIKAVEALTRAVDALDATQRGSEAAILRLEESVLDLTNLLHEKIRVGLETNREVRMVNARFDSLQRDHEEMISILRREGTGRFGVQKE